MNKIDLGKLKFTWKGSFLLASTYEKDDCVEFEESTWIYVDAEPSAGFTPGGVGHNKWELMAKGKASAKTVFAGGPANNEHHVTSDVNTAPNVDLTSHHIPIDNNYVTQSGGLLTIVKPAKYRFYGFLSRHCGVNTRKDLALFWNGLIVQFRIEAHSAGWITNHFEYEDFIDAGQTIAIKSMVHADSNTFSAHHHSYHSRMFLEYKGD